jgi:hypothetical protein
MRLLRISFALFLLAGGWNLRAQDSRDLIFVARRSGVAEVLNATTLDTLARIHVGFRVERFSASADGSKLEIAGYAAGAGCCKHYMLDPGTGRLKEKPAAGYNGNFGDCLTSPDGHWCFQLKSFRGPALKMVNLEQPGPARVLTPPDLPEESSSGTWGASGVWSGAEFYLYVQGPDNPGFLWNVRPGAETLGAAVKVAPFGEAPDCRTRRLPVWKSIVAAAGNVFLYEPFGSKADRTAVCGAALPGGAWVVDPATGGLRKQIAPEFRFSHVVPDTAGTSLYGVALGVEGWDGPVRIVKLDAREGTPLESRTFDPGVLQIGVGRLQKVPAGDVSARLE